MQKIYIENIDTKNLKLIKESTSGEISRCVYFNSDKNEYVKMWNKDYAWNCFFSKANLLGVYKNISLLKYVIYDKDENVRGYITRGGKSVNLKSNIRFRKYILKNQKFQNEKYEKFLKRLYKVMNKKNIVYLDLSPDKIVEYNNKYYLFDLEMFIRFEDLFKVYNYRKFLDYCPTDYVKYSKDLISQYY